MKKLLILLSSLIIGLSVAAVAGCSSNNDAPPDTDITVPQPPEEETTKKKFTGLAFTDKTVTYDGNEHEIVLSGTVPEGAQVSYTSNKGTNAGVYDARVTVSKENYETLTLTAKLTVNKAKFTGLTFSDKTVTYDGNEHEIVLSGTVPEGAQVSYTSNNGTNAGVYNASVTISKDNYETLTLNAKLTVNKAKFTGLTFNDKTFVATGSEKKITVEGELPENTKIEYDKNTATEAGVYNATAVITNPNYETLTLNATLTIKSLTQTAKDIVGYFLDKPDAWSFMPEALYKENLAYTQTPTTDFTNFVNVSAMSKKFIGKQLHVLYEGLTSMTTVLGYMDAVYSAAATIANVYQTFINDNPDDYALFTGEAAGFKFKIALDGESGEMLIGNSTLSAELKYDRTAGTNSGRIQITDGMALKYESGENKIKFAVKATISGVGNIKQIEFVRTNGAVAGYLYEYTGTESKNLKTSAVIASNAVKTVIMSNKRETDDLLINGYEEVYSSVTGEFIGGEVRETVKAVDYDTLWFPLGSISGLSSVKAIHETNGVNADTIYLNGSSTPIKTKLVGGLSLKATSRRFDIEMKDAWFVVKKVEDGKTKYETVKTSVPMLFVQIEQTDTFTKDFKDANGITSSLPTLTPITADYEVMQQTFMTIRESVTFNEIIAYIGEKNSYFA